ncbi:ABC transporter ATP-binding protein [Clostridiaceae bacterium M8S5]|nr:ABC transporter ATP-binding protein [Clostridiaceae bacterium M8S5]
MKAIEINNLEKRYGEVVAVNDVSFSVKEGSICAILGPNGSGKTTIIKSICNLIIPDNGQIMLYGKENKRSIDKIAALFEGTRNLYWRLTPRENLRYFAGLRGIGGKKIEKEIDRLLDMFNLGDKKDTVVNKLSRGMRQKTAIAMTLICDTDIILLDEPTLGLDISSFIDIKDILRDIASGMNKTILLSTHNMDLVEEVCDDVVILNKGKLVTVDSVSSLKDMFKSKTYEIVLSNAISNDEKQALLEESKKFYFTDDLTVEVDIMSTEELYSIIDTFKEKGIYVKEIKQNNINFGRIYLSLTNGGVK